MNTGTVSRLARLGGVGFDDKHPVGSHILQGHFSIMCREYDDSNNPGEWIQVWEKKNVIVNGARKIMAHLIGDCEGSYSCLNEFRLGGDNSKPLEIQLEPPRPTPIDTDILFTDNLFIRTRYDVDAGNNPLFSVSYPAAPEETSVLFTIAVLRSEGNILEPSATCYNCAGLFSSSNTETSLFASQTFPVMTKKSNNEFSFRWNIRF